VRLYSPLFLFSGISCSGYKSWTGNVRNSITPCIVCYDFSQSWNRFYCNTSLIWKIFMQTKSGKLLLLQNQVATLFPVTYLYPQGVQREKIGFHKLVRSLILIYLYKDLIRDLADHSHLWVNRNSHCKFPIMGFNRSANSKTDIFPGAITRSRCYFPFLNTDGRI